MADNTEREAFEVWYLTDEAQHAGMRHGWQGIAWAAWQAGSALAQGEPAAIAAPGVAQGWKPISTAPKEEDLLGWREDCGVLLIMHTSFDRFASERECDETDEETLFQKDWFGSGIPGGFERLEGSEVPTHWMPLPAAPSPTAEQPTKEQPHG